LDISTHYHNSALDKTQHLHDHMRQEIWANAHETCENL